MNQFQQILQQVIKPDYHKYYQDWIECSKQNEARGLQLIGSIYQSKGRKKFKAKTPSVQMAQLTQSQEIDYNKAEEMYRQDQITSTYKLEFGYLQKELAPQNNIFKYKKCSDLQMSEPLTDLAKQFIDSWIELKDELEFQELVIACLRSIYARFQAQNEYPNFKEYKIK